MSIGAERVADDPVLQAALGAAGDLHQARSLAESDGQGVPRSMMSALGH
jgi:hypothetical protein